MDGSDPDFEYKRYIPFEHSLHMKNPERGFVSSANQHQVDSLYPYYTYADRLEYYRGRRINDRLRVLDDIIPKDMMKLQNDNFNYQASESLPMMLDQLDTSQFTQREWNQYTSLAEWDYFNEPLLKAPSVYQLWWDVLYRKTWDELDTISIAIDRPNKYVTIHLLKSDSSFAFADILETPVKEDVNDLVNITFKQTLDSLENWQTANGDDYSWYVYKNTSINHLLPPLKPFSVDKIRVGGYGGIVNAAGKNHGPSWRMVVELDPTGTRAWGVYPGSQTGNPGSPDYGHMIDKWAAGEYYQLLFGQDITNSDQIKFTQQIEPKSVMKLIFRTLPYNSIDLPPIYVLSLVDIGRSRFFGLDLSLHGNGFNVFISGFLGGGLVWLVYAWYIDTKTNSILSAKVVELFPFEDKIFLVIAAGVIGALVWWPWCCHRQ